VTHTATEMNVCNRNDINSSNDEFHGNRHTSEMNKLRAERLVALRLMQRSEYKWHVLEPTPLTGAE
jgi:hypothetical protein